MKVFLCESIHPNAMSLLCSRAEVISNWSRVGEVDAIISRNLSLPSEILEAAASLKVIAIHGTGSDCVDLAYCRERGITVAYVPYQNSDSVAELIVGLTLALMRNICAADRAVKAGENTENAPPQLYGTELSGKVIGFIGTGDIAVRTARIFREGFRANTIGFSPNYSPKRAVESGIDYRASMEDVLREADVICPCVHLSETTEHLLSDAEFSLCKPSATFVNASRGGIVDEDALLHALQEKRLTGAACDVWRSEPPTRKQPLAMLPNVIALPHLGASTDEALERVGTETVRAIFDVLDGKRPQYVYE